MGNPPYLTTTFDVGMASWNYFSLVTAIHIAAANMNFVTRSPSCTLVRNSAMPTYFYSSPYPVLNLLHAPRVPQKQRGCSLLHLLAIRTRCTPSVRKFAVPIGARVESVISNMNEYFVPIGYMKALYRHLRYEPMSLQRQIHTKI